MNAQELLQSWLDSHDWKDELEVDGETGLVRLATSVEVCGLDWRFYLEASETTCFVDVYCYSPLQIKDKKRGEMLELLNTINLRIGQGRFALTKDLKIQYNHRVDFEGLDPDSCSVNRMVVPIMEWSQEYSPVFAAVALTKQTAAEAWQEFLESQEATDGE